ncbi:MAG: putative porin, partial [Cytophagales bacterium]
FYEFDRRNQRYTFGDPLTDISTTAGQNFYIGKYKTSGNTLFNQEYAFLSNKVGFKTHWGNFVAGAYYKNRYVMGSKKMSIVTANALVSSPIPEIGKWFDDPKADIRLHENYIGGFLKYKLADSIHFEFNGEFMASLINKSRNEAVLDSIIIQQTTIVNTTITSFDTTRVLQANPYQNYTYKGDYNFNFKAYVYNFELGLSLIRQTPSLVNYYSLQHNLYHWYQGLQPSISNNIYAKYHFNHKQFFLEINPSIYQLQNYVYFNSDVKPVQTEVDKPLFYGMMDVTFNTHVGILHLDTKFKYTYIPTNQPQVVRMPAFYVNPRIYIKYVPKSKINKQDFRFGFDIYYRSTYYGDVYMPSVGQFFVQNSANDNTTNFKLKENVLIDFFVTAKLRNARIFLKINQLNQLLGFSRGYYISPFYPATNGSFQLGVHWLLFD